MDRTVTLCQSVSLYNYKQEYRPPFIYITDNSESISVYSHNLSINFSHAGVQVAQPRWGAVQGSFNQCYVLTQV